jgi:hypothetical protein
MSFNVPAFSEPSKMLLPSPRMIGNVISISRSINPAESKGG